MKVKIVEGTGEYPPEKGCWYNYVPGQDKEFYRKKVQRWVDDLEKINEASYRPGDWEFGHLAEDFLKWKDWTYDKWLDDHWGRNEEGSIENSSTNWIGVVYSPEPEFNEFGEISP